MKCASVRDALPLYVGGDLPARVQRRVGLHVERCGACRAEFESYCEARQELSASARPVRGDDTESLADAVTRELVGVVPAPRPRGRLVFVRTARAAALVAVAVGAGAFWWGGDAPREVVDESGGRTAAMPSDLTLRKLDEIPPIEYRNPGRFAQPATRVERAERDDICIIAGPGIALRVAVPDRAPRLPMNPRPRVRPHGYRPASQPVDAGIVTH